MSVSAKRLACLHLASGILRHTRCNVTGAMNSDKNRPPTIYVSKYNRFVDNIIGRVNRILRRSYDPVRVKLTSNSATKKNQGKKRIANASTPKTNVESRQESNEQAKPEDEVRAATQSQKNKRKQSQKQGQKQKKKNSKSTPKARATLYGLSSIKRDGDVTVNLMADHTTVKTDFALGPLTLKVEKEFGRGAKRELKSATATTEEMRGKLVLRVNNDGSAKLHSIRVMQPKQVRVDSPDEHDRTREFIWRRSSHIAHLVSQKLASATRSMLKPSAKSASSNVSTAKP